MADESGVDFLSGGDEMGELIRTYDWARTPLGPPAQWPQSLRVTVRLLLNTRHPMFIWWGPDLIQFYNDAYRQTMGPERHPTALGSGGASAGKKSGPSSVRRSTMSWPARGPHGTRTRWCR